MADTQKKILIVEDEEPMLMALAEKLSREGFTTVQARDGEEAFDLAIKEQPDLILLDLLLPKMNGVEMMKKLRAYSVWGKRVPIIVLTNVGPDDQMIKDIEATEPAYYLVKSGVRIEDVVNKVRERLGMAA